MRAQKNGELAEEEILHKFTQLLLIVRYLHERNIIIRNITPETIFIKNNLLKLSDLVMAIKLEQTEFTSHPILGSNTKFMAPEIFYLKPYNHGLDVWGLGCILICMCELIT